MTRWALQVARERGHEVVAALLVGGTEKLRPGEALDIGAPVLSMAGDRMTSLGAAIATHGPEAVLDLSDEPVLGYRERMELAAVALSAGLPYLGSDFRLDPPVRGSPLTVPTIAVIGTGKRTGKTAIAGTLARLADGMGLRPVVVAMGRGGPAEPEMVEAGSVGLDLLLRLAREGRHAASDHLEDALTTGVTTIGARRAGGGLAGAPWASNVREAAELAAGLRPGLVILEGSGSAVPPVPWDAGVLVVPASAPPEYLSGYLGPFRLLLSELAVLTMTGDSERGSENLSALRSCLRRYLGDARHVVTDFFPVPLGDVQGRRAFFATTAPEAAAERQVRHLESAHGCIVVGWSARLSDRADLERDLDEADDYDVLLTELKAAAVDVACERASGRGAEVVFVDNRAETVEGHVTLEAALRSVVDAALVRGGSR